MVSLIMAVDLEKSYLDQDWGILLADDQKFMIKNLERYFKKYFKVYSATTLEMAKNLLASENIAVVISDHQMLDGQGIELLKYVRDNYTHIRKVVITADRHEQVVVDMIADGMAHSFVYKPTVKQQLHQAIVDQIQAFLKP